MVGRGRIYWDEHTIFMESHRESLKKNGHYNSYPDKISLAAPEFPSALPPMVKNQILGRVD